MLKPTKTKQKVESRKQKYLKKPPAKPPECDIKATSKRVDRQAIGTLKPPQSHLKATLKLPQCDPKATPRLHQSHPKATQNW
jgi:hypothetical protein